MAAEKIRPEKFLVEFCTNGTVHSYRMFFDTRGAYENIKEKIFLHRLGQSSPSKSFSGQKYSFTYVLAIQSFYFSYIYLKSHV
jgi:hypothetical protein